MTKFKAGDKVLVTLPNTKFQGIIVGKVTMDRAKTHIVKCIDRGFTKWRLPVGRLAIPLCRIKLLDNTDTSEIAL